MASACGEHSPANGAAPPCALATQWAMSASAPTQALGATVSCVATGISQSSAERVDAVDLGALARGLAQALREQRVILAQERADDQRAIELGERRDRRAQPAHAAGVREVGVARAVVDALAAERAHELGQQVQFLDRRAGVAQRADAGDAELALDALDAVDDVVERGGPVDRLPLAALLDHRGGQAGVGVQGFVREAVAVGDPALVDVLVLVRDDAQHLVVLDLDDEVGADRIVRARRCGDARAPTCAPGSGTAWT